MTDPRPDFGNAAAYVEHVGDTLSRGGTPWPPATVDELRAVAEEYPDYSRRWLPAPRWLSMLGLRPDIGRPAEPLPERWRDRLLATLVDDVEFRRAVGALLRREVSA